MTSQDFTIFRIWAIVLFVVALNVWHDPFGLQPDVDQKTKAIISTFVFLGAFILWHMRRDGGGETK